ncbi:hypothetical protein SESBI_07917 [Sesbania bispinosa]|nr:hypothetical protein SESBI_07917 [Sesbania bispinosa]
MAEILDSNLNLPPTMEQRMERLEGSFSQILELLKTVIPEKEVINDNSNGNDNDCGGTSVKTNGENPPKVVIVTESSGPDVKPVSNPPPKWYNPAETCKYHMGTPGYTIERCWTFKLIVQKLRDAGQLSFKEAEGQSTGASVDNDPLLKH